MPKRVKTPPPAWDDEPTYLTVYQPYPINANMELPGDRKIFALWLACVMGDPKYLVALFHKPSSPNMVIIEVDRAFGGNEKLLGEHKWSEFLLKPEPDEVDRSSKVYYCKHNTGRKVEKAGWKRKMVEDGWFSEWRLHNSVVKYPYPPTRRCELPREDITNEGLCRPLPVEHFPPPPPAVKLPPAGSEAWREAKEKAAANPKKSPTVGGAWAKGAPIAQKGREERRDLHLWGISPPGRSSSGSSEDRSVATPSPISMSMPPSPPGLPSKIVSVVDVQGPPGLVHPSRQTTVMSSPPPPLIISNSDASDEYLLRASPMESLTINDDAADNSAVWELEPHVFEAADMAPVTPATIDTDENLWGGYGKQSPEPGSHELMCSAHGTTCAKGICRTYKEMMKRLEREKQAAEGGQNANGVQVQKRRGREGRWQRGDANRGRGFGRGSRGAGQASTASTWRNNTATSRINSASSQTSWPNKVSVSTTDKGPAIETAKSKTGWDMDDHGTEVHSVHASPDPASEAPSASTRGDRWATASVVGKTPWDIADSEAQSARAHSNSPENVSEAGVSACTDRWATDSVVGPTPWDSKSPISGKAFPTQPTVKTSWADLVAEEEEAGFLPVAMKKSKKGRAGRSSTVESRAPSVVSSGWGNVSETPWS